MNDLFNENQNAAAGSQQQDEQATRRVEPVPSAPEQPGAAAESRSGRRRRTERFAGLIGDEAPAAGDDRPADAQPPAATDVKEAGPEDGAAQATPSVRGPWQRDNQINPNAFAGVRVPPRPMQTPSQGVPRPAALSGQSPRREQEGQTVQTAPVVRRPVNAEGYSAPLQQLGKQEQPRVRRPEQTDTARRVRTPETEYVAYEDVQEQEEKGGSRGLIAVIIALLVIAALILGLIMIPEEDTGVLGSIKRAVTEPVKELLGFDDEDEKAAPASADSFTATISHATAPYKVVFHMVTSSDVTAVRVVNDAGEVIPTVTTLSAPNSESTIVWMLEMTTQDSFEGVIQAQMQDDGAWLDTGLTQTLSLGGATPVVTSGPVETVPVVTQAPTPTPTAVPAVTDVPVIEVTAAPEPEVTATPEPEATAEPVAEATATAEPEATEAPAAETATPAPEVTDAPTAEPTAEPTATPTLSVTAMPTLIPTTTPTLAPTEAPTPVPTEAPTAEPTATPEPTPVVTPRLEAAAAESADPGLISTQVIYKDGKKVDAYEREKPMNMPAGDAYLTRAFGVTTFRGNAFRQNAAVDTVDNASEMSLVWTVEAGSVAGSSRNYYGIGWSGQPVIAKWPSDIRKGMELEQIRKDQKNMKEVIVAGLDGQIYFLDLNDGTATRDAIDFGYPMRSTPSLHPLSYPMMTVGQYARKLKSGTGSDIGLYYYNLMNQKELRLIDGLDRKLGRPYYSVGAFDTSALIDRNTNTLIAVGTNGLLYTEALSMEIYGSLDGSGIVYEFNEPTEEMALMSHTRGQEDSYAAVESSLAMYGSYAYYADMDGILRCVDTTTMTTAWAVDTGDAVRAAIALDLEADTNTLWLYTANLVNNNRSKGDVTIRRFNAMTGEEDWAFAIHCAKGTKKDVTFNNNVIPGAMASPVIGQNSLNGLVYFTLSSVSATGAKELSGDEAMPGVIIALDKATGEVVWHREMEAYCYSSPVAVYNDAGEGWIIQGCSNGTLYLLNGLTGETVNTLAVNGVIEASPAVYGNMLVIGTTGKNTSYIYGISID